MITIGTKLDRNMTELLNLEEKNVITVNEDNNVITPEIEVDKENEIDSDFDKSKKNLEGIIEIGTNALTDALYVAKQSDDPDAYDVVANLMKQLADINDKLLNLHLKMQKYKQINKEPEQKTVPNNVTNNAIFVGSNAELLKLIKQNGVIDVTTKT